MRASKRREQLDKRRAKRIGRIINPIVVSRSTRARPANTYRAARRHAARLGITPWKPQRPTATHSLDKATLRSLQRPALRFYQGRWGGRAV